MLHLILLKGQDWDDSEPAAPAQVLGCSSPAWGQAQLPSPASFDFKEPAALACNKTTLSPEGKVLGTAYRRTSVQHLVLMEVLMVWHSAARIPCDFGCCGNGCR